MSSKKNDTLPFKLYNNDNQLFISNLISSNKLESISSYITSFLFSYLIVLWLLKLMFY